MRDAFGGTFMLKIFIIFLVFYITFMTIAVSYAKVFRIKNRVIDMLEFSQYNGSSADNNSIIDGASPNSIASYLDSQAYNVEVSNDYCKDNKVYFDNGKRLCIQNSRRNDGSFKVTLYLVIKFPLFGSEFVIPVSGETRSYN